MERVWLDLINLVLYLAYHCPPPIPNNVAFGVQPSNEGSIKSRSENEISWCNIYINQNDVCYIYLFVSFLSDAF
jgi:hypothetical protein